MVGGFRVILGILAVVVVVYSAMSIWPILTSNQPSGPSTFTARNYAQPASGNLTPAAQQSASPSVPSVPGHSSGPRPALKQQSPLVDSHEVPDSNPEFASVPADWVYAKRTFSLLTEPGGNAHRAFSLCNAELELLSGTRLVLIRTEDEWVLVRTPGNIYGWTHESLITAREPPVSDRTWKLYPSGG